MTCAIVYMLEPAFGRYQSLSALKLQKHRQRDANTHKHSNAWLCEGTKTSSPETNIDFYGSPYAWKLSCFIAFRIIAFAAWPSLHDSPMQGHRTHQQFGIKNATRAVIRMLITKQEGKRVRKWRSQALVMHVEHCVKHNTKPRTAPWGYFCYAFAKAHTGSVRELSGYFKERSWSVQSWLWLAQELG